jgi:hypothetical protein
MIFDNIQKFAKNQPFVAASANLVTTFFSLRTVGRSRFNGRTITPGITVGSEFSAAPFDNISSTKARKLKFGQLVVHNKRYQLAKIERDRSSNSRDTAS